MANSKILNPRYLLPFFIIGASLFVSYVIIAQAQTSSEQVAAEAEAKGVSYPVAELGNCGSKQECRSYCDQPANIEACVKFAKSHGLMNGGEADRALKFQKRLLAKATPGGCNSPESCESYCSNINNLEACLKFAEDQGFEVPKVDEAKKILAYIKTGGQMPGGCTSEASCKSYCSDFNNAEECFTFAQKVGLEDKIEGRERLEPEQFRKFIELAKKGETPGGCRSKEQCESYCQSETNREECIAFGEKMGFLDKDKAEMFRKTGGKGPGDCNSEESCKAYCDDPGHQEECFKFAEEHSLVKSEDIKEAKEGFVRVRQGLENAPPEVAECLKSTLGPNIIEDIQSGQLTPGIGIGERVRACFEKFGHRGDPKEAINQAPPEMMSCVKEKLGDVFEKIKSGEVMPTPEMGDAFRICGQEMRLLQGSPGEGGGEGGFGGGPDVGNFLRSAPPGVSSCLKEKIGDEFEKAKQEGTPPGQEVKATLRECFESFRPETPEPRGDKASDYEEGFRPGLNQGTLEKFRQEGGFQMPEGFKPPEGTPQQFREQFQQQFQGEFQKQYDQQYQQQYQTPPTSEPAPTPAPAPTTEPAPQTQRQYFLGNIIQAVKSFYGF